MQLTAGTPNFAAMCHVFISVCGRSVYGYERDHNITPDRVRFPGGWI